MFQNFPYTDMHQLNLDWIVKIAKDFLEQYTHIQQLITDGEQSLQDLTTEGINQLQEKADNLETLLQAWYDTHSEDIAEQLADALNDLNNWYTEHQNYLDNTLQQNITLFDQHAVQKAEDTIATIPSDYTTLSNEVLELEKYNSHDIQPLMNGTGGTNHNLTYTKNSDGTWTINGTSDDVSARNIGYYPNELPYFLEAGRKYFLQGASDRTPIQIYFYNNTTTIDIIDFVSDGEFRIPDNANGMLIRFRIPAQTTFNNETVSIKIISSSPYTDESNIFPAGTADRTKEIYNILENYGVCRLAPGDYYIKNLTMPDNTAIIGSGKSTKIHIIQDNNIGYAIKICKGNVLKDFSLWGNDTDIDPTPLGIYTGILFEANYGAETEAYSSEYCSIMNIEIYNFSRFGISCNKTSINYAKGLYAVNVYIYGCHIGLNIEQYSEFHKFTNVCIVWCWYACLNNAGNNVFTACTFHATHTGFFINGANVNTGHGILNGCVFAHIGSNEGRAIYITGCRNGFVINGCQVWFNSIVISTSVGVMITNCEFGRSQLIQILGGDLTLISNCSFQNDVTYPPTITVTAGAKLRMVNCYGAVSGDLITP